MPSGERLPGGLCVTAIALIAALTALVVSVVSPIAVIPWLRRIGALDVPSERSLHTDTAVRGVGIAPLSALVVGFAILIISTTGDFSRGGVELLLVAVISVAAGLLGAAEDIRGLSIRVRAGAQFALGIVGAGVALSISGSSLLWLPLLAFAIAGYINVANFMDGVNGISALHGFVAGLAFSLVGALSGLGWMVAAGLVIAASFVGFFPWNVFKRGTFLGDVGSYLLGGSLSMVAVLALAQGVNPVTVVAPISVYLADTSFTLVSRIIRGERWTESHRSHVFQRLTTHGLSHLQSTLVVSVATAATSALGLIALQGTIVAFAEAIAAIVVVLAIYLALPTILGARRVAPADEPSAGAVDDTAGAESFTPLRWAVLGSTGFIGRAIVADLVDRGIEPVRIPAPRLQLDPAATPSAVLDAALVDESLLDGLAESLDGIDVVVNAAGLASPDSGSNGALFGANALLPAVVATAAARADVKRVVHLSSAAVQGRRATIDESPETAPFSPYSHSKALGEHALAVLRARGAEATPEVVIVRATSVQGPQRETTQRLRRLASSRLASVAAPGDLPTVVSSVGGLVAFVFAVATHPTSVPAIVLQPWEGLTTAQTLLLAGGKRPILLPAGLCRAAVAVGYVAGAVLPPVNGIVRRVELMWLGQRQDARWATSIGLPTVSEVADVLSARVKGIS